MRWAIVLAGGRGTRFWPESTRRRPKHLLHLFPGRTLFDDTLSRLPSFLPPQRRVVVTVKEQAYLIRGHLRRRVGKILQEPFGKNTAAAVAYAALWIEKRDPDATVVALPADHAISKTKKFQRVLSVLCDCVERRDAHGTLGIEPDRSDTGFGYLERGAALERRGGIRLFRLKRFVEKPTLARARAFLASGRFYWNSGIFVWKLPRLLGALRLHLPRLMKPLEKAMRAGSWRALRRAYSKIPTVSIDTGVMERERDIVSAGADIGWSDLGTWESLAARWPKDRLGNRKSGEVVALDALNNILKSAPGGLVAVLGVSDLIVVRTDRAVLVVPRSQTQRVRELVRVLGKRSARNY